MFVGIPRWCFIIIVIVAAAACSSAPASMEAGGPSRGAADPSGARRDAEPGDEVTATIDGGRSSSIDGEPVTGGGKNDAAVGFGGAGSDGGATGPAPDGDAVDKGVTVQDGGAGTDGAPAVPLCAAETPYTGLLFGYAGGPNFGNGRALGQCGFPNDKLPAAHFYGALDSALFAQAAACGACVRIESMDGKLTADIQIIDRVDPTDPRQRAVGHLISADAAVHTMFGGGGNPNVRFRFVPCDVSGNIQVQFDANTVMGSSVMVMSYRTALGGVQVATAAGWRALGRTPFNRWSIPFAVSGVKNSLRFLDRAGRSVDAAEIPFVAALQDTGAQFPPCSVTTNDQP
jgi:expansin